MCVYVCVYSNSRNDVPRVAQRYGTIAAHTRRRASVLIVFVLFSVHKHSFPGLIRQTLPLTFSDTAITNRHSDTTIFPAQSSLGADILVHWIGKIVWTCANSHKMNIYEPVSVKTGLNNMKMKIYITASLETISFSKHFLKFERITIVYHKDMGF